jgi:hypothetical protein
MESKRLNDITWGERQEKYRLPILQTFFGDDIESTREKYGSNYEFDFYNDNYFIEMKSRRCKYGDFPTLFFGENKLIKGDELLRENPNLKIFYTWNCRDAIYFWEHKSSPYSTRMSGRNDRGRDEYDICVHVQNKYIKKLTRKNLNLKLMD